MNPLQKKSAAMLSALLALNGCASSNQMITKNIQYPSGEPRYDKSTEKKSETIEDRAHKLYTYTGESLAGLLKYVKMNPNVFADVNVQQVGNMTQVTFKSSTKKGFFPSGIYNIAKIVQKEDRDGLVFTDIVANETKKVLEAVKNLSSQVIIEATYSASADGAPIRNLKYAGEFDDVRLSKEYTSINGVPTDITIKKGEVISNNQLAALRATSLSRFIKGALSQHTVVDQFILSTTTKSGLSHRWVSLVIKIVPAP